MTGRVFLVRHGNTFAPREPPRRIGARTDLPLVASGIAQAKALGEWFATRNIRFARAVAGPLRRTQQTAAIILHHAQAPPAAATASWLTEIDHGPDEDQPEDVVLRRVGPAAIEAWDKAAVPPPGWIVDAAARITAWRAFLAEPSSGDTLLVTSNGAARFALLACPDVATALPGGTMKLRTGAYAEIGWTRDNTPTILAWDVRIC